MTIELTTPALLFSTISLLFSLREIQISVGALDLHLQDIEDEGTRQK